MKNSEIRRNAAKLYAKNWAFLISVFFLLNLTVAALYVASLFLFSSSTTASLIAYLLQLILAPVTCVGIVTLYISVMRGEKPSLKALFSYCKTPRLWLNSCLLPLLLLVPALPYVLIVFLFAIASLIHSLIGIFLMIILIPCMVVYLIWIYSRLFLTVYYFADDQSTNPLKAFKQSFMDMKHNVGKLIWFNISLMWWFVLLAFLLVIGMEIIAYFNYVLSAEVLTLILAAVLLILTIMITPYFGLAQAGFALPFLDRQKERRMFEKAQPSIVNPPESNIMNTFEEANAGIPAKENISEVPPEESKAEDTAEEEKANEPSDESNPKSPSNENKDE